MQHLQGCEDLSTRLSWILQICHPGIVWWCSTSW